MICSIHGCHREVVARELCDRHYRKWKRWGDPLKGRRHAVSQLEKFWDRVDKQPNGCWFWTGVMNAQRQPTMRVGESQKAAHRWAYETFVGPIPPGIFALRDCDQRCVNPDHVRLANRLVSRPGGKRKNAPRVPISEVVRKRTQKASTIKYKYGITVEQYNEMLMRQGFVCAICQRGETRTEKGTVRMLTVDHDHETGDVRGLLCGQCNTAIGRLGDDPEIVERALAYLRAATVNPSLSGS